MKKKDKKDNKLEISISDNEIKKTEIDEDSFEDEKNDNENNQENVSDNGDRPTKKKNKKLPSIYRGNFTKKKLDRRILKKIYIPADRKFVEAFYSVTGKTKKGTDLFSISPDKKISKKEYLKLCLIAKELKSQKGRIKWIPLLVVASFIFIVSVLFTTFKNIVIKSVIQDTCESIFQAKCDIDKVNFKLFDASFKLYGLQIANKNAPMTNIIEIDSIVFDFDLTQMLRLRFITDEISINGVKTNTKRKYSGDISEKLAKQREKKRKQEEKKASASPFMKTINQHIDSTVETIQNSITGFINYYNPTTVIETTIDSLTIDDVAKEIEKQVYILYEKWSVKPEEISLKIQDVEEFAKKLANYDYSEIADNTEKINEAIELAKEAYTKAKEIKNEVELLVTDVKTDFDVVQDLAINLDNSIKHDKSLIESVINRYKNLNMYTIKNFIAETLNRAGYSLLGKYYPMVNNAVSYLVELKNMNKEKGKKTEKEMMKSMIGDRSHGRTVYYKKNPPKFWIKKVVVSGNIGNSFNFSAYNISSNMDQTGLPAKVNFSIKLGDITHSAAVVVDCRSYSSDPIVLINYNCDNLGVSTVNIDDGIPGVPMLNARSNLDGVLKIYENDGFSLTGTGIFTNMDIISLPFEPEYMYKVYSDILSRVKETTISATVGYTVSNGILLNLETDLGDKIYESFMDELKIQVEIIQKEAEKLIIGKINQYTEGVIGKIESFEDIVAKFDEFKSYSQKLETELKAKQEEYERLLKKSVNVSKTLVETSINNKVETVKEDIRTEIKDASMDYIKGILKKTK